MRVVSSSVVLLLASLSLAIGPARAQALRVSWLGVDGATATAFGVLWSHGYDDDDVTSGLAHVLAASRLERARAAAPGLLASGLSVGGDFALVFGVVDRGDLASARAFLAALLDDRRPLGDDELALVIARAALTADDAAYLYPGPVFEARARRRLGRGTAAARLPEGDPIAIAALTPEEVRRHLLTSVPVRVAALGFVDDGLVRGVEELPVAAVVPADVRAACTLPARDSAAEMLTETHWRVDSPTVAAAFPAPPPVDRPALAVGLEVARARAQKAFRSRGTEAMARTPYVGWRWLQADPLVLFCRRGEHPVELLPGQRPDADIAAEAAATAAELRRLLADLRDRPPSADELAAARRGLTAELRLPGPGETRPWAAEPAMLPGRLMVMLLAEHHGIDVPALERVTAAEAHRVLRATLLPARGSWHGLLPQPRQDRGFRRR